MSVAAMVGTSVWAEEFTTLKGHGGPIMGLAVAPDGRVASASFDNSVGLWTGSTPVWLEGHDAAVVDAVFATNGDLLSGGDDFSVWLWREADGRRLGAHKGKVTDLEVSPDGSIAASASWGGQIGLWSLTGQPHRMLEQHDAGYSDVAFSPNGERLYASTSDGDILVYRLDVDQPQSRRLVRHGFGINEMILSQDESWLAYGAVDGVTRVIDPVSARELRDFTLDRRPILAMAHHADTGQLAVGDGQGYIMMVDTKTWRIARDFRAMREGPVWALAFSNDGAGIYAGGLDDVIYSWPVSLLGELDPQGTADRSFLRDAATMSNGERQFMRKCSICHALDADASRKAGPTLYGVFGRQAGTLPGYSYSDTLRGSQIIWSAETIDALFDLGPDHYIPNSKMPMQRITDPEDRQSMIEFLLQATEDQ